MQQPLGHIKSAASEWNRLDGLRSGMMSRFQRLAELTIPSVFPEDSHDNQSQSMSNGFNSLGAQAVTHLVNKLMLTMFAPSRPFMRLDMDEQVKAEIKAQLEIEDDIITDALAQGEKTAMKLMEQSGQRQTLYTLLTHLVVLGNVLLDLDGDTMQAVSIKDFVVRRNAKGKVTVLILREKYQVGDLEEDVREAYLKRYPKTLDHKDVQLFTWIQLRDGKYHMTKWVDDVELGKDFAGNWSEKEFPYKVLTWQLPLNQHYGIGRCEDYFNDLAAHEELSGAILDGAALATSFRWLANPAGITRPEDIANSPNGGTIPGVLQDVNLLFANVGQQLNTVLGVKEEVSRRIGQGFLLSSAVTRDAERVTAEEIRIQANELESSLGGIYTRLALDIQTPLAHWLLRRSSIAIENTKVEPVIITGLDALSRNSDRERMMLFLNDVTALGSIPPDTRIMLRETNIISDMAAGAGVERQKYVASQDEIDQRREQMQQQQLEQVAAEAAAQQPQQEVPQ